VADFCDFSTKVVASAGCEAWRRAQLTALKENLEGSREDSPPALQARQLLCIFCQPAQKMATARNAFAAGSALACELATVIVVCLACRTRVGDGMQEQWPAGDGLHMPVRLDQTNEDAPPVVKQRDHARGQSATSKVLRDEAAPAPLVFQFIKNILAIAAIAIQLPKLTSSSSSDVRERNIRRRRRLRQHRRKTMFAGLTSHSKDIAKSPSPAAAI